MELGDDDLFTSPPRRQGQPVTTPGTAEAEAKRTQAGSQVTVTEVGDVGSGTQRPVTEGGNVTDPARRASSTSDSDRTVVMPERQGPAWDEEMEDLGLGNLFNEDFEVNVTGRPGHGGAAVRHQMSPSGSESTVDNGQGHGERESHREGGSSEEDSQSEEEHDGGRPNDQPDVPDRQGGHGGQGEGGAGDGAGPTPPRDDRPRRGGDGHRDTRPGRGRGDHRQAAHYPRPNPVDLSLVDRVAMCMRMPVGPIRTSGMTHFGLTEGDMPPRHRNQVREKEAREGRGRMGPPPARTRGGVRRSRSESLHRGSPGASGTRRSPSVAAGGPEDYYPPSLEDAERYWQVLYEEIWLHVNNADTNIESCAGAAPNTVDKNVMQQFLEHALEAHRQASSLYDEFRRAYMIYRVDYRGKAHAVEYQAVTERLNGNPSRITEQARKHGLAHLPAFRACTPTQPAQRPSSVPRTRALGTGSQ